MSVGFSTNGPSTTLLGGITGPGSASNISTVFLFSQSGSKVSSLGAMTLLEQGHRLRLSPLGRSSGAAPSVDTGSIHFVATDYQPVYGSSIRVQVGISKDGTLVIEVSARAIARMSAKDIALLGMSIAQTRFGVDPTQVKEVVVRVH